MLKVSPIFLMLCLLILLIIALGAVDPLNRTIAAPPAVSIPAIPLANDPSPPTSTVKLIFIHHSCGENWLNDSDGGLGIALRDANYFVSDTNYGWGPPDADLGYENIGDHTDIGHWYNWFVGPNHITYTQALYTEYGPHSSYTRGTDPDPSRENQIIMFKSCYPNSHLGGNPTDPPTTGDNPLRGQDAWSEYHTVANAKGIYNDLLTYFTSRQDKLFIVVTAPPLMEGETDPSHAANARAFNDWLVNDWLDGYAHDNVAVWDFYNALTSNGGDANTNDLGAETGNHHRWWNGAVQYTQTVSSNYSAYPGGSGGGSHPTSAGNLKATGEFVELLNVYYNRWRGGAQPPPSLTLTAPNGDESWVVGSQHAIQWNTAGTVAQVNLAYSDDGFATRHDIATSLTNTGSYDWTVPDDPGGGLRVRVESTVSPTTVYDDSDADFSILPAAADSLILTVPNGGESWVVGSQHAIQWSTGGTVAQVNLAYSDDGFATRHDIATSLTNTGSYDWTVPDDPGGGLRVRVESTVSPTTVYDDSDADFSILPAGSGEGIMIFQDGVSPSAGYAGTADVILANDTDNVDPNANLGGLDHLETFFGDGQEHRRGLIRWDLSALPADITIDGASLELYRYDGDASNDMQIALYRVTREWDEGTGQEFRPGPSYTPDGATWLTATAGVAWTTPGGDYNAAALDQVALPAGMSHAWVRLDATAAVRDWVQNGLPNDGLFVIPQSGDYTYHYFHSRNALTATLRPRLVVTYTQGGVTPPDYWLYMPIILRNHTPQPPSCPNPLTGVTISGPTSGLLFHEPASSENSSSFALRSEHAFVRTGCAPARRYPGVPHSSLQIGVLSDSLSPRHSFFRPPSPQAQPTNLSAFHRSGQTFLTWTEDPSTSGEAYHVYRHTAPIDAGNIDQATRLTERWGPLPEGSSIFYTEIWRGLGGDPYPGLPNYVITDLGAPLTDTTGLFVWTSQEAGDAYYAVTTVEGGVEDRTTFGPGNSLTSPVAETTADPEPILVWDSASGNGRVYTQFMDFATFNPTYETPYDPPDGGLQYAYNYFVGLPTAAQCGGSLPSSLPVVLHIEGHGSRYEVDDNSHYFCAVEIWNDDPRQSWYFGFSATYDYRTGYEYPSTPDTGPIVNYSEARLLRSIYDTLRHPDYAAYNLDPERIYVYGHSMGGSGALALAMRYPNLFAASYSSQPMTNYQTSGDGGGVAWNEECQAKWGSIAANFPISNVGHYAGHLVSHNGTGVWDWQNHQANLVSRAGDDMAYISLAHGTLDQVIEWSTQGQLAYEPFYQGRRAFSGATIAADHTWIGWTGLGPNVADLNYEGPFYNFQVVRDETLPGLSYASGSSPVPPSSDISATYNLNLEWSASWYAWDGPPIDSADQWRLSLRTTDGSNQTVDVTPRRLQHFVVTPGASYDWENRLVSDDSLVASGVVTADADGLVTVEDVAVSPGGNRLLLTPAGGPAPASLTLTAPTGGEDWGVGSQHQIQWTTSGSVAQVNLTYSTDSFATTSTIASAINNSGSYTWTVPDDPSATAQVRVESVLSPTTVYDVSGAFSLSGAGGGDTYTFTAVIAPSNATGPVNYAWSPAPASGQGTAVAAYQWDTAGVYTISVVVTNCGGSFSDDHTITIGAPPTSTGDLDLTLTVSNPLDSARQDEPVTSGVPLPRDLALTDLSRLRLLDGAGEAVPAQFTPLARWGGASDDDSRPVRWLLLDFQADVPANGAASYRLVDSGGAAPSYPTLSLSDGPSAVTVSTGAAQFSLSKSDGGLSGPNLAAPALGRAVADGVTYTATGPVSVSVELAGDMRAVVHVKGSYRDGSGAPLLDYTNRYWFYAGRPGVRLFHTLENNTPCPLDGEGQISCHDIGSAGSVTLSDVSLVLPTDLGGGLTYQAGGEGAPVSGGLSDDLILYQDSSGTDHWDTYPTFTDWEDNPLDTSPRMQTYVSFRGYRTSLGATTVDSGDQASGWLSLSGNDGAWTVGVRDFWQNFPKALRANVDGSLEIGLFPDEFGAAQGYDFNLRAGEHKTHEIWLAPASSVPLFPLFAQAPAQWYLDSGALSQSAAPNWTDWPEHEQYIDYQLTTSPEHVGFDHYFDNLFDAIASTDFYGLFDYGDWPLDYEGYEVAPMNPKYHNDYATWLQWARGGDPRWFGLAEAANRHFADVDILHTLHSPRHWSDGIPFGHSAHDEAGFANPHRNRNSGHPDTAYGMNGLLSLYYLTGYEKGYESALELADCIEYRLHNDSHLCGYFSGDCSGEGYGLGGGDGLYNDGGRPAANTLFVAANAYRATADPRYLEVADALVQWADPNDQPYIGGPTGTSDYVKPWMLNMYLRALAEYIQVRTEFGLADEHDAAGDFLAYADWLHTHPWLDLAPIETGARASYPYQWWFDGRAANDEADVSNWTLLGSDAMAYAYSLSGTADYLEWATQLFRTGSRDPFYEGDVSIYSETKQTVNSISYGHLFLYQWGQVP